MFARGVPFSPHRHFRIFFGQIHISFQKTREPVKVFLTLLLGKVGAAGGDVVCAVVSTVVGVAVGKLVGAAAGNNNTIIYTYQPSACRYTCPFKWLWVCIITSRCREPIVTRMRACYKANRWASNNRPSQKQNVHICIYMYLFFGLSLTVIRGPPDRLIIAPHPGHNGFSASRSN